VGHANYPSVTKDALPASLSKKWISSILREKIGYRGLIVSDDMEMGAVLKVAPIEQVAVEFIRAGGDLGLICRQEEFGERIAQCSERLSRSLRRAFKLRAVDGLSIRETAKVMEGSHGTVKARLARARASLKHMLRKSVGNEGAAALPRASSR